MTLEFLIFKMPPSTTDHDLCFITPSFLCHVNTFLHLIKLLKDIKTYILPSICVLELEKCNAKMAIAQPKMKSRMPEIVQRTGWVTRMCLMCFALKSAVIMKRPILMLVLGSWSGTIVGGSDLRRIVNMRDGARTEGPCSAGTGAVDILIAFRVD